MNTENILVELRKQKSHLQDQLGRVDRAIVALAGLPSGAATAKAPKKRTMSAAARRKIAAAMRARWAKQKAQQK